MVHFLLTEKNEKKKGRREGGKKERRERKEEGGEERRKERKEAKKECKCVFRHFQLCVVDSPPPTKVQIQIRGWEKMTHFSLTEKRKRRKEGGKMRGGKERRKEGKKKGRKERKDAKKRKVNMFLGTSNSV